MGVPPEEVMRALMELEKTIAKLRGKLDNPKSRKSDIDDTVEEIRGDVDWLRGTMSEWKV